MNYQNRRQVDALLAVIVILILFFAVGLPAWALFLLILVMVLWGFGVI